MYWFNVFQPTERGNVFKAPVIPSEFLNADLS